MDFATYHEAYDYAVEQSRKLRLDHGIEKTKLFGKVRWSVRMLPRPENCQGFELRMERVTPESPKHGK